MESPDLEKLRMKAVSNKDQREDSIKKWNNSSISSCRSEKTGSRIIKIDPNLHLLVCTADSDMDEVERLLKSGVDVNYAGDGGLTPLHQACIDDNPSMVKLLIDYGASVNKPDNEGLTALHASAGSSSSLEVIKMLLDHAADPCFPNHKGDLPVDLCGSDEEDKQELLTKAMKSKGVDTEAIKSQEYKMFLSDVKRWIKNRELREIRGPFGDTPLHFSISKGYHDIIKMLLKENIDLNAADNDGWTALHSAVYWSDLDVIKLLVDAGADMYILDNYGYSALDFAETLLKKLKNDECPEDYELQLKIKSFLDMKIRITKQQKRLGEDYVPPAPQVAQPKSILVLKKPTSRSHSSTLISRPPISTLSSRQPISLPPSRPPTSTPKPPISTPPSKPPISATYSRPPTNSATPSVPATSSTSIKSISRPPNSISTSLSSSSVLKPPGTTASSAIVKVPPSSSSANSTSASKISFPPGSTSTVVSSGSSGISKPPSSSSSNNNSSSSSSSSGSTLSKSSSSSTDDTRNNTVSIMEVMSLRKEIEALKEQLAQKDKIIEAMKAELDSCRESSSSS